MSFKRVMVTGGAGFIGSNYVHYAVQKHPDWEIVVLDKLTYAGNLENLEPVKDRIRFIQGDIADPEAVRQAMEGADAVLNFAAESHVDRSLLDPRPFVKTNVEGTLVLLEEARKAGVQRFLHVSTDEVYGSLAPGEPPFRETNPYAPNSPYAASKAASDHLVRAYHHTYSLPTLTTNCSNNYGPFQFPEKLIPLCLHRALAGETLPLYGDGQQIRDWLYVADHCRAIRRVLEAGRVGETYNIGGRSERRNLEVVQTLCAILDELKPRPDGRSYAEQITFVRDRPGHDRRYAMDITKIERELGWRPAETFESGLRKTVRWYLDHPDWVECVTSGEYRRWVARHYA